ncbi:SIMPL domain-containing protein [Phaeocystidibacter marisrubri]|uniref:DUF541 domain-containing protein n=1 Tax=Phaeocystidibacter marisrubri TaxID=1577780 RepID=A0A6L3ZHQ5_9FLAO|nr:SIMPL domain-containing protein [Phaeocystidibacter marisrubri]KAB2816539.1 DUF541 domain-containing protein [Phaeocystidibacter marisrubri]GGH69569.1 hypothetical protein GCM10011318_10710 [Phaeocystidibacter marisrubri]
MKRALLTVGLSLLGVLTFAQEGIQVTGKVVRYVESDEMVLSTSISATEETVAEAFAEGTKKSRAVLSYLQSLEDVCEVQTQQIRLSEKFEYHSGRQSRIGFIAEQRISIRIKDFDQYPIIMEKLIALGVDGVSNVEFVYSKENEVREQLRLEAIEVAVKKAEIVASGLGVQLGTAQSYSEGSYVPPMMENVMYEMKSMDGMSDGGPAISPAKTKIEMEVHVRFAILAE